MRAETKRKLYEIIKLVDDELRFNNDVLTLISSIWNVYQRSATGEDKRYRVLGDEIDKHYFMNEDWQQDKLYLSVLHILDDERQLLRFVEGMVNIAQLGEGNDTIKEINQVLEEDGLIIIRNGYSWEIKTINSDERYEQDESLPFVRCKSTITDCVFFKEKGIELPTEDKCFVVTFNNEWNDYFKYYTWFRLYFKDGNSLVSIGSLKIMSLSNVNASLVLPEKFLQLGPEFCSLGSNVEYYAKMKELFGDKAYIYLGELRDAALYGGIRDRFEDKDAFKSSLIRYNDAERALRMGRYYTFDRDIKTAFSFIYHYEPAYDKGHMRPVDIDFDFQYECEPYHRMIGLIGENGVGKSTLLNNIIESFIGKDKKSFVGLPPVVSKVIAISYSPFDKFPPKHEDNTIEYHYCGLLKSSTELFSKKEQIDTFMKNLEMIARRGSSDELKEKWLKIMSAVVDEHIVSSFFEEDDNANVKLNDKCINDFCKNMSSGESIYVYSLTEIMANIRLDTLLLFDEPEQHLHPHGITTLMRAIYDVLEQFESYAIIATHSPLVIREMLSDNVYTFERNENLLSVAKIGIECFGEDVSVLSDVVFKNMADQKKFEHFIEDVAEHNNYDYDAIIKEIKGKHNNLGMGVRLLILSVINRNSQHYEEA